MKQATVRPISVRDVAAEAGVSLTTATNCLNALNAHKHTKATRDKVLKAAKKLGYNREESLHANVRIAQEAKKSKNSNTPANKLFKSRDEETAAMITLRNKGYSNVEIAHRCGVNLYTVSRRIGLQPAEITAANVKLAGAVKTAKRRIKQSYQAQQTIVQYNELAAKLNSQLEEAKVTATQLKDIQASAKKAAKITGVQLVTISNILQ